MRSDVDCEPKLTVRRLLDLRGDKCCLPVLSFIVVLLRPVSSPAVSGGGSGSLLFVPDVVFLGIGLPRRCRIDETLPIPAAAPSTAGPDAAADKTKSRPSHEVW